MIEIAEPSARSLFLQMRVNGHVLATGTGFIIHTNKGPALITNRHNVTGKHQETGQCLSRTGGLPNEVSIQHNDALLSLGRWHAPAGG